MKVLFGFFADGLPDRLRGLSPSELVEFQVDARGRDRFLVLRAAQVWVDGLELRVGSKQLYFSYIRSFFLHNLASLPVDRSFVFHSVLSPIVGRLEVDFFRRILLNCNKMYKAVFLMMAQGVLGSGELLYVSNNHARHVLKCLSLGGMFKVSLPGRKRSRNIKGFYSVLSAKSDWGAAMRDYLQSLDKVPVGCLFVNENGNPLKIHNIQYYFHSRAVEAGVIEQSTPECRVCGGRTVRKRSSEHVWYVCKDCNRKMGADGVDLVCLRRVRYGVNPHEIRDLMRSRWQISGADPLVCEHFMGHEIDPNAYNKFMSYEPQYVFQEYKKALPYLNVLSNDPNKIDRTEVEEHLAGQRAETELLKREVTRLKKRDENLDSLLEVLRDPEKMKKFKKLMEE